MGLLSLSSLSFARGPSDPLPVGYRMFPSTNVWYTDISAAPISSSNTLWINVINGHAGHDLHADFGTTLGDGSYNGIPYNIVYSTSDIAVRVKLTTYASESDTQPVTGIPLPTNVIVEDDPVMDINADRHLILVDVSSSIVYEMFASSRTGGGNWQAAQFTTWFSSSNLLRTAGWTSADAGGLPLLVGLIRWDEIQAGVINHAIRFTLSLTHGPYLWPARHDADSGGTLNPPFGMRVRMKANVDISFASATDQIIFTAMKKYGMIMADNGGDWFVSGAPNPNWDSTNLHNDFITVGKPLDTFEVVDESTWAVDPTISAEARAPTLPSSAAPASVQGNVQIKGKVVLQ